MTRYTMKLENYQIQRKYFESTRREKYRGAMTRKMIYFSKC